MWRIAILLAACSEPPAQAFVVDGFVDVATSPQASVIGLWEVPGSPVRYYKLGDGVRLNARFTLGFDVDPPPEALDADGVGVAYVYMLPELTTVPDGFVNESTLGVLGRSGDTAIVYKTGTATTFPQLGARFSCVQCIRNAGGFDRLELIGCASVIVEGPGTPLCNWF